MLMLLDIVFIWQERAFYLHLALICFEFLLRLQVISGALLDTVTWEVKVHSTKQICCRRPPRSAHKPLILFIEIKDFQLHEDVLFRGVSYCH